MDFSWSHPIPPRGDQRRDPAACGRPARLAKKKHQGLLGVTGSGKTFTRRRLPSDSIVRRWCSRTNRRCGAPAYTEFRRSFLKCGRVLGQLLRITIKPEAYIARLPNLHRKGIHDQRRDRSLRLSASGSYFERRDVVIVASGVLHLRFGITEKPITACC